MPSLSLQQSCEDPTSGQAQAGGDEGQAQHQGPLLLLFLGYSTQEPCGRGSVFLLGKGR